MNEEGMSQAVRAAYLHYIGGLTQADIARRLGVTPMRVHRLIAKAHAAGLVKISIEGQLGECVALEEQLSQRFGLSFCQVAPDLGENDDAIASKTLGHYGAAFLRGLIEERAEPDQTPHDVKVIGLGHGRTLTAAVQQLPPYPSVQKGEGGPCFVSLLGGLTRNYAANPYDVMHDLAKRTGLAAYVLPVPFFANTAEDRDVLLAQRAVKDIYEMACNADIKILGLGSVDHAIHLSTGVLERHELDEIIALGGKGEMLGRFYDARGRAIETSLSARTLAATQGENVQSKTVAIAGGPLKHEAIAAVLMSQRLDGLITDEASARFLLTYQANGSTRGAKSQ